jgi:hypothetical protein
MCSTLVKVDPQIESTGTPLFRIKNIDAETLFRKSTLPGNSVVGRVVNLVEIADGGHLQW